MSRINSFLNRLQSRKQYKVLTAIVFLAYLLKGKKIRSVKFLDTLGAWRFKIGDQYFFSSGPGWAYDYDFLLKQFLETSGFQYQPKKGDCVVDVGAGVGEDLMLFSKLVGDTGRVIAIEAHPKTFEALRLNCDLNNLRNVTLLNIAVADKPGHIYIEGEKNDLANKITNDASVGSTRVDAITIEQLVEQQKIDRINFMKVNIEGAEQLLIKGIGTAISRIDNMAISCHDFRYLKEGNEFFKTRDIVVKFLAESNFDYARRDTGSNMLDDYLLAFPRKGSR